MKTVVHSVCTAMILAFFAGTVGIGDVHGMNDTDNPRISFFYDDSGNKIQREFVPPDDPLSAVSDETEEAGTQTGIKRTALETEEGAELDVEDAVSAALETGTFPTDANLDDLSPSEAIVTVYPNPTQGLLRVEIDGIEILNDARIYVYDMMGVLVGQFAEVSNLNDLDISTQQPGIYIIQIVFDTENVIVLRIVKE